MKIIILADKYQKGSKSQGCSGLLKINNSTVLEHQYQLLSNNFSDAKILYIYGFDNKKLAHFLESHSFPEIQFIYNKDYEKYNECFSLDLIKHELNTDILILSGYTILTQSFFKNFSRDHSQLFIDPNGHTKLGCIINSCRVENIFYDLDNKIHGVFYISSKDIATFHDMITIKHKNAFLFEIINKCISQGCNFTASPVPLKSIKYHQQEHKTKLYDKR